MICNGFGDPFGFNFHDYRNTFGIVLCILPNRQAPNSMQNIRRELAKNFGKLVITNVHLETVQGILQFSKRRQLQQTASYKIMGRRCARRMAHTDIYNVYRDIYIYITYIHIFKNIHIYICNLPSNNTNHTNP